MLVHASIGVKRRQFDIDSLGTGRGISKPIPVVFYGNCVFGRMIPVR
jgi:hypothetical protein